MKSMIVTSLLAAGLAVAGSAGASQDLAQKAGCIRCHATANKKIGPSIKEISAKYKGKAGADVALVAKLKAGKDHPSSKASADDLLMTLCQAPRSACWVFRRIVTGRFGIVTDHFGNVTGDSGGA